MQKLVSGELLSIFDQEIIDQARGDYRRQKVMTLKWEDNETLIGRVSSARQVHTAEVHFYEGRSRICCLDCTCEAFYQCRHTASTLIAFLENPASAKVAEDKEAKPQPVSVENTGISILNDLSHYFGQARQLLPMSHKSLPVQERLTTAAKSAEIIPPRLLKAKPDLERSFSMLADAYFHENGRASGTAPLQSRSKILYVLEEDETLGFPSLQIINVNIKKDGTCGTERPISTQDAFDLLPDCATDEDYAIMRFWHILKFWHVGNDAALIKSSEDFSFCLKRLIARIVQTGRCCLSGKDRLILKLAPELPGQITWQPVKDDSLRLAVVALDGELTYQCLFWHYPWYINAASGELGPVKIDLPESVLASMSTIRVINKNEALATACLLTDLGLTNVLPAPPIDDKKIEFCLIKPSPKLVLSILRTNDHGEDASVQPGQQEKRALQLSFPPAQITDKVYKMNGDKVIIQRQDKSGRKPAIEAVIKLGFNQITEQVQAVGENDHFFFPDDPSLWADLDDQAIKQLRSHGLDISKETEAVLRPLRITEQNMTFSVTNTSNWWCSMELHIDVQGQKIPLLPILKAALNSLPSVSKETIETLNRNGNFVTVLESGNPIIMPFARVRTILLALQELLDKVTGDSLQVSSLHAAEILADKSFLNSRWFGAEQLMLFVKQLGQWKEIKPVGQPSGLKATLRPYQLEGVAWLQSLARFQLGGILADDMGLGKTVQILAHILFEKEQGRLSSPFLVVCPTSVLPNWSAEVNKFAPGINLVVFAGANRGALLADMTNVDIVLTTYGLLKRDLPELKQISWHGVALDEAQAIKNPLAKVAECAKMLTAKHRICLTGTPVENHLGELWSQFDFLLTGLLGDKTKFNRHIRIPVEKEGNLDIQAALAARIRPFILRRTKSQVLTELPEKTVIVKQVELTGQQLDLYETVRLAASEQIQAVIAKKGFNKSQIIILECLLKLRQACCDPRLLSLDAAKSVEESAKLETLMEMITQLVSEGRKILVFSQFTSMLDLIAAELKGKQIAYAELRGNTKDRESPVVQFQESDLPVFLISLKAGGMGLNLTAADVVIHYEPWWNPAVEDQASDRAYRIGQDKHVFVYKLIARGTIEEFLLQIQERKRNLASSIYDGKGNFSPNFTESDLSLLLRPIDRLVD